MQFSIVAFLSLASLAFASPLALHQIRSCDALKCAIALGPTGVGCTAAAVEVGANPIADAGCLAGVLNSVANAPASCAGCSSSASGALGSAENAISGAFDDVKSGVESIF